MSVKRHGDEWVGICDHGGKETWEIHRATEYLAHRSLKAHQRECLPHALLTELPEEDEHHPLSVLGVWVLMLAEDYGVAVPDPLNLVSAAAFLERVLHRVANDEEQDFPLFAREIRKCRAHLESVQRDSQTPERGVPCPTCVESGKVDPAKVRLVRDYPHWCDDEDCHQIHVATNEFDVWVCPRDPEHWWSHKDYTNRLEARKASA